MVQPGQRNKRFVPATGRMSESRWAWVRTVIGQVVIMVDEPGESEELLERKETGRSIRLIIPLPGRKPVTWNLTALTEAELLKLKELVDAAFAWALPVVRQRDKEAQDAFEAGDDSYVRVYRAPPQLVFRKRPEPQYGESLLDRPQGVPEGGGRPGDDGGLRGAGSGLAEHDEVRGGPEDDGPQVDQSPQLR